MTELQIFGTHAEFESSEIVLIPVRWDVTTSYGRGTSKGPEAIYQASPQIDFHDYDYGNVAQRGIYMLPNKNRSCSMEDPYPQADPLAKDVIDYFHSAENPDSTAPANILEKQKRVNLLCERMVDSVYQDAKELLQKGKSVGLVGGDHSCPLGLIKALSEVHDSNFGVLHIDAHADLRKAYQGFTHSHASIMYNVLQLTHAPSKLVQVGIRDYCEEELALIESDSRIQTFFGPQLFSELFKGKTWHILCEEIIQHLPEKVYISFDIDGMNPEYCPNTGTPVPGGLSFMQVEHLLRVLKASGKSIIGFDLCEVTPDPNDENEWDGNVGARVLYKLCGVIS